MPKLNGVVETAVYVDDIARAQAFYEGVLGLKPLMGDARFRALDAGGQGVFLLFRRGAALDPIPAPGGVIPPHDGSGPLHFAFAISKESLPDWLAQLGAHGVAIEGRVDWPRGGVSVYFRDPDGNLVELATPGLWPTY